ncbi:hypothetical protein HER10_EVM0004822 [Colletotrichum scovillei]|uniref:uncharacterized protein n=1 Tax=Colletotrichum scovillei TaxID=1209932 RepID=UPI0015C406A4|nr:uncharacterized protein HER10_EVM0004822 [Colletotrichum scovillei]KAF4779538.1 hypothetical protein HER10_EVM0004822 [Colletotrichum scovillei]
MEFHPKAAQNSATTPLKTHNLAGIFHKFPQLPLELRFLIWEQALYQLDAEGQPLFVKLPQTLEKEAATQDAVEKARKPSKNLNSSKHTPRDCKKYSVHGTPSMHFVDANLWLACKESQTALKKAIKDCVRKNSGNKTFKISGSQNLLGTLDADSSSADETDPSTTGQIRQRKADGWASAVTFNCRIFCYQLWKDKEAARRRPLRFPFESTSPGFRAELMGTQGMVFEYDYSWMFNSCKESVVSLMDQKDIRGYFLEAANNEDEYDQTQIYLIDYGICLKPGAQIRKSYSCGDRRFNEVCYSDFDMGRSRPLGAKDFLEEVHNWAQDWADRNGPRLMREPSFWTLRHIFGRVRVLVCELAQ